VPLDATRRRALGQILLLTAGFLVLVAISTASVILVNKSREDNAWVVHTVEVENQTNALLLEIRRAEGAARGYLLTSGLEFLADHKEAVAAIIPELDKLAYLVSADPVQTQYVAKLRTAVELRLSQFAREIALIERGNRAGATALVREAAAGRTTTAIRDIADEMHREEDRLFALRTANADRSQRLASVVTLAGSGLVVALAGVSVFLVRRSTRARSASFAAAASLSRATARSCAARTERRCPGCGLGRAHPERRGRVCRDRARGAAGRRRRGSCKGPG